MKFSRSLLGVDGAGERIFNGSIDKAKILIKSIFDIDFNCLGTGIKEFSVNQDTNVFTTIFEYMGRTITARLSYVSVKDGIIQDVLEIIENPISVLDKNGISKDFKESVNLAMDILEKHFNLEFTPLEPEEKDENIKNIISLEPESLSISFTQKDCEGDYKASVLKNEGFYNLDVSREIKHIVFLE